jgi:hypothetical protein
MMASQFDHIVFEVHEEEQNGNIVPAFIECLISRPQNRTTS